mgnify:CR=1 FL=1
MKNYTKRIVEQGGIILLNHNAYQSLHLLPLANKEVCVEYKDASDTEIVILNTDETTRICSAHKVVEYELNILKRSPEETHKLQRNLRKTLEQVARDSVVDDNGRETFIRSQSARELLRVLKSRISNVYAMIGDIEDGEIPNELDITLCFSDLDSISGVIQECLWTELKTEEQL